MVKTARLGRSDSAIPPAVLAARASDDIVSSHGKASETPAPRSIVRREIGRCLMMFMRLLGEKGFGRNNGLNQIL